MVNFRKIFGDTSKSKDVAREKKSRETYETHDKFFILSSFGELLDLAVHLKYTEKKEVVLMTEGDYKKIGEGIVDKAENWIDYLGDGWIFVIDGCENAHLQDWLRKKGEFVVGTNEEMSEYENDRQKGQELFKKAGFKQPESITFQGKTAFDDAIDFIKKHSK